MGDTAPTEDGILKKLEAILGRIKTGDDEEGEPTPNKAVDYPRFFKINQRRLAAEEALAGVRAEVDALKAAHAAELKQIREDAAAGVGKLQARHQEDLALYQAGFDADGMVALRSVYERLPEQGRPKSALEYWQQQTAALEAHRADPEKVKAPELPKTLTPYLPQPKQEEPKPETSTGTGKGGGSLGIRVGLSVDRGVDKGPAKGVEEKLQQATSWADFDKACNGG